MTRSPMPSGTRRVSARVPVHDTGMLIALADRKAKAVALHEGLGTVPHRALVLGPVLAQVWRPLPALVHALSGVLKDCTVPQARTVRAAPARDEGGPSGVSGPGDGPGPRGPAAYRHRSGENCPGGEETSGRGGRLGGTGSGPARQRGRLHQRPGGHRGLPDGPRTDGRARGRCVMTENSAPSRRLRTVRPGIGRAAPVPPFGCFTRGRRQRLAGCFPLACHGVSGRDS